MARPDHRDILSPIRVSKDELSCALRVQLDLARWLHCLGFSRDPDGLSGPGSDEESAAFLVDCVP